MLVPRSCSSSSPLPLLLDGVRGLAKHHPDGLVPGLPAVEFVQAALCRRELLVEIEGVAECRSASDPRSR